MLVSTNPCSQAQFHPKNLCTAAVALRLWSSTWALHWLSLQWPGAHCTYVLCKTCVFASGRVALAMLMKLGHGTVSMCYILPAEKMCPTFTLSHACQRHFGFDCLPRTNLAMKGCIKLVVLWCVLDYISLSSTTSIQACPKPDDFNASRKENRVNLALLGERSNNKMLSGSIVTTSERTSVKVLSK